MAVLKRDEFFERIKNMIGDNNTEDAISFLEDMTDTYNDMETRTTSDINWEQKYNDLDAAWKARYKNRFFTSSNTAHYVQDEKQGIEVEDEKETNFEDLFAKEDE